MAYAADKKPGELTALATLATDDVFVVGDTSDVSEVAKYITKANLITDLGASFGNVTKVGTPANNQVGVWTGDGTLEGDVDLTFDTATNTLAIAPIGLDGILRTHIVQSDATDGVIIESANGTDIGILGAGNTANATWYGSHNFSTATQDTIAAFTGAGKTLGSLATATYPSLTELSYVKGVTSAVQTQLNAKQATITFGTGVETALGVNVGTAGAPVVNGGALGTPSSGTLTNATGLPLAGVVDSTTEALGVGSLEVGHASDTTITRISAGLIAVEGSNLIRASDVDDTPVNGETAVPVSSNWAFDHAALASSDTVVGHIEVATTAETNTGTDATRAVSPDGLAGSYAGTKSVSIQVYDGATDVATGDGKAYITIPEALNGMNLIRAQATVVTAGTTNATTVMIHNKTDANDMLSGAISIASAGTVGTVGTINGATDDVATNDVLRIDVDSVSTTAPKGLQVILEFRLP